MFRTVQYSSVCALVFVAACAVAPTTQLDEPAELSEKSQETLARFEVTGDTLRCVSTRRIRDIKPLSDDLLLVRLGQNSYYLNKPTGTCESATRISSSINYKIDGEPNLCKGETVQVVSNRSGAGSFVLGGCALGEFEELREKDTSGETAD